ncbi:hypothetical protein SNE40_022072 [Patella caerulea]|uniref:Uncharacterized protein n=1 Tax=Patella caerulea TaxID=87958 RepID=A0AAN8G5N8_PATCE
MATQTFYRLAFFCAIVAFVLMFVAFASPYWYKSWTRVHSPFSNIGLWHICLAGYVMPADPNMKTYVGCWWIHSSEFDGVKSYFMPSWFMGIQALSIFTLILDGLSILFLVVYISDRLYEKLFEKKRSLMYFVASFTQLLAALFVFLIALVFAEMCNDPKWMPRPWMNYLSWGYGFCVLSGFFNAFGGMFSFVNALIFKDKEKNYADNPDRVNARENKLRAKEMEAAREREIAQEMAMARDQEMQRRSGDSSSYRYPSQEQTKVGESFV